VRKKGHEAEGQTKTQVVRIGQKPASSVSYKFPRTSRENQTMNGQEKRKNGKVTNSKKKKERKGKTTHG
jgi:hypothetical protein